MNNLSSLADKLIESEKKRENDAYLIKRCQDDVPGAFDELVAKYEKCVYNYAYRISGNYNDASDVTQEAFIRAYTSIKKFRGDANFTTWIYRIATNIYLDEHKKISNRKNVSLEEKVNGEENTLGMQLPDKSPTPDKIAEKKERNRLIREAVQSLPKYQRIIITLYQFEDKSYEEISELLQLPIGTVKSRLNRARIALMDKLKKYRELIL